MLKNPTPAKLGQLNLPSEKSLRGRCIVCKKDPQWYDPRLNEFSPSCGNFCRSKRYPE
jgi:hypothetical protein